MTLVFSLLGGLLIAAVVQLVFANLGIALGLTLLDFSPKDSLSPIATPLETSDSETSEENDGSQLDQSQAAEDSLSLPVTHFLGFGVAIGLSTVIFIGTLLSVEFSGLLEPRRGIIFGLIFWSTYWLLFIWLCSTTITGITDSLIGGAIASGKQLISTIKHSVGEPDGLPNSAVEQQSTIKELTAEVSKLASTQDKIPQLLSSQKDEILSQLNTVIEEKLERTLDEETTKTERFSEERLNWQRPSKLDRTEVTVAETDQSSTPEVTISTTSPSLLSQLDLPSWQQVAKSVINQVDLSNWDVERLIQQLSVDPSADLLEEDLLKTNSLQKTYTASQLLGSATALLPNITSQTGPLESSSGLPKYNDSASQSTEQSPEDRSSAIQTIQTKLEDYCRYTSLKLLTPQKLSEKVELQLQAHNLSAEQICTSRQKLSIASIEAVLLNRQKLPLENEQQLVQALKLAWPSVPSGTGLETKLKTETKPKTEQSSAPSEDSGPELSVRWAADRAYQTVEQHLHSVDWGAVSLEDIKPEVIKVLDQLEREGSFGAIDWQQLVSRIQIHYDLQEEFAEWLRTVFIRKFQSTRPAVIQTAKELSHHFSDRIAEYLEHREKSKLQPAEATEALSQMVGSVIASLARPSQLGDLIGHDISLNEGLWDRARWQQALESRKDMTEEEIQRVIEWGERVWQPKAEQVSHWLQAVQSEVSKHLSLPKENLLENASREINQQVESTQTALSSQIAAVKEEVKSQVTSVQEEIQTQVDNGRKQIAIAAWWLFIAFVWSGSAAAGAGWLATNY
ncbi:hypothetical protein S7335_3102 [Synechococcus sp. PCC 7335]|uniref:hypothetical protein n=1 Tax=Synechococcus sp. (strain ATCC 29403 / PCC 7335) TaxID=91464 RepID=UPI00017ED21F|nr:hypothetical protein [Synechococcus sp. PCC 7335]EDX85401.1 hypothetical protein S7335_3102 [Synechococcus sp. PCC 7335]